ncbi:hypothetical protein BCV72DRAFT_239637 [Rhizopus microsporus var. microsporus]|uniref:CUE domain-containing protein n=2 Tax=Rhizopus microsporus TaxID=58291 RepID=A0A2G4T0G2_RHIZD|nr:uncharacterized protein RHIMIDRAFT_249468 [Rhizopus microsporus ATCC 52813]ORE09375.1 hypothetical protein BCV72DRAFT_239637 [Rhizopus microsporus var. microsporus]PHZ14510.1 hypothetical protein RHIMIDRAFT_249468 [Rhizopus microsporus ATCC 52813]
MSNQETNPNQQEQPAGQVLQETTTDNTQQQQQPTPVELKGPVKTLKDAFPDLDVDVIETILDSQGGNLDATFEILLGMSDPSYKPEPSQEQMRQDEAYARQLAREGDAHYPQDTTARASSQGPAFNLQEELPVIKEKMIEAGTAAKNKIVNFYNQFMAGSNSSNNNNQRTAKTTHGNNDLLETRMGSLSLMDDQPQRPSPNNNNNRGGSVDLYEWDGRTSHAATQKNVTSTPNEQLMSDEEFARRIAREEAELAAAAANRPSNNELPIQTSEEEIAFKAVDAKEDSPAVGYTIQNDDLDDLINKKGTYTIE